MNVKGTIFILIILLSLAGTAVTGKAQPHHQPGEYDIKAAFLYNMIKFTEWPTEFQGARSSVINLCVLGDDPFGSSLNTVDGQVIKNRKIAVRRIHSLQQLRDCQVLFISASEGANLRRIVNTTSEANILTVADTDDFARKGVIINFYISDRKVRFEINTQAAERARLKISSNLLKLGNVVR